MDQENKFLNRILAMLLAITPLVQWQEMSDPTLLPRQFLLTGMGLVCLFALVKTTSHSEASIQEKNLFVLVLIWIGAALSGMIVAVNLPEGLYSFSKYSAYVGYLLLLAILASKKQLNLTCLAGGIVTASAIGLALLAAEMYDKIRNGVDLWDKKNLYDLHTAFGHKNLYSSFQLLCLPFYGIIVLHAGRLKRIGVITLSLATLFSLLLIQTKAVWLGIFTSLLIYVPLAGKRLNQSFAGISARLLVFIPLTFIGLGFLIYLFPQKFTLILNNDTVRERALLWSNTLSMIADHPVFGTGPGNWQVWFPKYGLEGFMETNYTVSDGYTTFQRPHNDFLWIWSECGPAGLTGYCGIFILSIRNYLKQTANLSRKKNWIALLLLGTLTSYLVVSLVDFPLERNEHQVLILLICGLSFTESSGKLSELKTGKIIWTAAGLLAFSLLFTGMRFTSEVQSKKILLAHSMGNWPLILKESKKIDPTVYSLNSFSIPVAWYRGIAFYALSDTAQAKEEFINAVAENPYQMHVLNNLAGVYELEGNHKAALEYYSKILEISSSQPDALLNKSAALFNNGQRREALINLFRFKYDENNLQFTYYLKIILGDYLGDMIRKGKAPSFLKPEAAENTEYLKKLFIANKGKKSTFEITEFPPYEN